MRLFFRKVLLLALPFLILILLYIVIDPYKKIWPDKYYSSEYELLSPGDVSTRLYLQNRGKYQYNSFVFGSSRATAYLCSEWSKYLPNDAHPFSYGAWNESILGIWRKIKLIDSLHDPVKNVLLIFDTDDTFADLSFDPLTNDHYLISGKGIYQYQLNGLINYYKNPRVVVTSIDYSLFHKRQVGTYGILLGIG